MLSVSVSVPALYSPPPCSALLPETVLSVMVSEPSFWIAPPRSALPSSMVSPEMLSAPARPMSIAAVVPPPLTTMELAPGPITVRSVVMSMAVLSSMGDVAGHETEKVSLRAALARCSS